MPLNAVGWTSDEDEKLVDLVQPHSFLYNVYDPSRKNILARESTWQEIAEQLSKPGKRPFVISCRKSAVLQRTTAWLCGNVVEFHFKNSVKTLVIHRISHEFWSLTPIQHGVT